jgi:hypothetical protein
MTPVILFSDEDFDHIGAALSHTAWRIEGQKGAEEIIEAYRTIIERLPNNYRFGLPPRAALSHL